MSFDENVALRKLENILKHTQGPRSELYRQFSNWKLMLLQLNAKAEAAPGLNRDDEHELRRAYDHLNEIATIAAGDSFTNLGIDDHPNIRQVPTTGHSASSNTLPKRKDKQGKMREQEYDVAISCAGEDTPYVDQVAECLRHLNLKVFYYRFDDVQVDLWGKNLYVHLDEIYRKKAKYCVMFLSKAYAKKVWTKRERESAQARAFEENRDYLLPVRFDDTEIPGIVPTISYVDANTVTPRQLCEMVKQKLAEKHS